MLKRTETATRLLACWPFFYCLAVATGLAERRARVGRLAMGAGALSRYVATAWRITIDMDTPAAAAAAITLASNSVGILTKRGTITGPRSVSANSVRSSKTSGLILLMVRIMLQQNPY